MNIKGISLYRQEIMGFAILQVILFHSNINLGQSRTLALFEIIKDLGYLGVDIFFFMSGFSLTMGWLRQKYKLSCFYKKRFIRIVPGFAIIVFLSTLCLLLTSTGKFFLIEAVLKTGIGFVLAKSYDWWFVPAIIFCYIIFPFLAKFIGFFLVKEGVKSYIYLLLLTLLLPIFICLVLIIFDKKIWLILFARIPNFILGIVLGVLLTEQKVKSRLNTKKAILDNLETIIWIMTMIGWFLLIIGVVWMSRELAFGYGFLWYPFIFLTFPLILLLVRVLKILARAKEKKIAGLFIKILSIFGGLSYELFLAHGFLIDSSDIYDRWFDSVGLLSLLNIGRYLEYFLVLAASFPFAIALRKFCIFVFQKFQKYQIS